MQPNKGPHILLLRTLNPSKDSIVPLNSNAPQNHTKIVKITTFSQQDFKKHLHKQGNYRLQWELIIHKEWNRRCHWVEATRSSMSG